MAINSRLAQDTQALRWSVLTEEEREIIRQVNQLILEVKEKYASNPKKQDKSSPWAAPERERYSNVVLLDGARGAGKTSLMLTMIAGWQDPTRPTEPSITSTDQEDDIANAFEGMQAAVRCLKPLDFDSLPPDLPLFNWIIQAFEPLVNRLDGNETSDRSWPDDRPARSLREHLRNLQDTAALGWTTGLLSEALAKDVGDFVVWHREQQMRWQELERSWAEFLDTLFEKLEGADRDCNIPPGAVLVLPIDDLDLQANRVRELLLVLRVLRHKRLIYMLTGDADNVLVCLEAEIYQHYIADANCVTEDLMDKVKEQSGKLAFGLFQKTVPEPNRFELKGLSFSKTLDWPRRGKTIGKVLEVLWEKEQDVVKRLKDIFESVDRGEHILFRTLQGFYDRWQNPRNTAERDKGLMVFLDLILGQHHQEEGMTISSDSGIIEFLGNPCLLAPAPRGYGRVATRENSCAKWVRTLDFASLKASSESDYASTPPIALQAVPSHLLAVDFAAKFKGRIVVIGGPRMADDTLGLVWSEVNDLKDTENVLVRPWPMVSKPSCPSEWYQQANLWKQTIAKMEFSWDMTSADLVDAWMEYNCEVVSGSKRSSNASKTQQSRRLESKSKLPTKVVECIAPLASEGYGLPVEIRKMILARTGQSQRACNLSAHNKKTFPWKRSDDDRLKLAMLPSGVFTHPN